jgi:glycerophosphoryl diester phosphodiesterase
MSSIMGSHFPAVSAHGPRAGTIDAYVHALETGAEYVEFDIRRTSDGELAAFHDARTRQGDVLSAISYARLCHVAGYEVPRAVKARFPEVPAALSLGRDLAEVPRTRWAATRYGELWPMRRLRACRADWVALNHRLAGAGVLAQCHRTGLKTMIWTVDDDAGIRHWLHRPAGDRADHQPARRRGGPARLARAPGLDG